jgi:predicted DNA-binding protein (UPF0251 family)
MNAKVLLAATVLAIGMTIAVSRTAAAATVPAVGTSRTGSQQEASRAELYRRGLLAEKDLPCRTNASCAALGVAALEAGRVKDAQTLVTMEAAFADATAMQAAEDNEPKAVSSARARVATALVHQGDVQLKLGALPNARAYYRSAVSRGNDYPNDALIGRAVAAARARLDSIAGKDVVSSLPHRGARFARIMFLGMSSSVTVTPVKGRRGVYRIDGDFVYPTVGPEGEPSANMGALAAYVRFYDGVARVPVNSNGGAAPLDATARITNLAPYDGHDNTCLIELALTAPETLDVRTHGSVAQCGFGHNVIASGRYYLMTGS